MIAGLLRSAAGRSGGRALLYHTDGALGYKACLEEAERLASDLQWAGARLGLGGSRAEWLLPRLFALDVLGARAYLIPSDFNHTQRAALCSGLGLDAILEPDLPAAPAAATVRRPGPPGEVVVFSSGTTAAPKPTLHTWGTLLQAVHVRRELTGRSWLVGYGLSSFAGIQVFLHALANAGSLVVGDGGPEETVRLASRHGVTHASGTPSFFRLLLMLAEPSDLAALRLAQITLGGEATDQGLLDALRQRFPAARLTQVYASTELGVCFSVHDGRAGLPAALVDADNQGTRLSIVDGELHVRPTAPMRGYLDGEREDPLGGGLLPTGDLVERRGDRVLFLGRRGLSINVGGRKAFPTEIEAAVLEVAGVRAVRVSAIPSALVGQLVRAEVVLEPALDPDVARRRVLEHCRRRLRSHMVPRQLEFVSSLDHTASRKLARS